MSLRLLSTVLISLVFLAFGRKKEKIPYTHFQSVCIGYDSTLNLDHYQNIFIIHIGFCASTKYCNEKMVEYIKDKKKHQSLVIYDMEDEHYRSMLGEVEGVDLYYIDRAYLQRHNAFSVYNIHIKKKRVKYLY